MLFMCSELAHHPCTRSEPHCTFARRPDASLCFSRGSACFEWQGGGLGWCRWSDLVAHVVGLLQDVQPGDRVGVLLGQSALCAASHIAIWRMGAISVPLFKLFRHDALESRLDDSGVQVVVFQQS